MGLQLVFVVETNKKCNSDWIYIKDTVEHFYEYDRTQIKFSTVYMDGKGKYKSKEKQVAQFVRQYSAMSNANHSKVLYCFDCDDYDSNPNDQKFLKEAKQYCDSKGYDFVWFCKDVEQVYIGKRVDDSQKKKESVSFKARKAINKVDKLRLMADSCRIGTSSIMRVLDCNKELKRKN